MAVGREEPTHWKTFWCWKRLEQEKGTVEDKMVGWHHWPNGFEFEQALGEGEGQEGVICCSPWDYEELGWLTEQQITTSNNKATECIWPWVVSGALDACHRSETLDSDKTQCIWLGVSEAAMEMCHNTETMNVDNLYGVFEVEWMKNHLKCVSQLKHYLITLQMVCVWSCIGKEAHEACHNTETGSW